jgi:cyanophycinase
MARTFLIGGGRDPEGIVASHAPFVEAAGAGDGRILVLLFDEPGHDPSRWSEALQSAGAGEVDVRVVSAAVPPAAGDLAGAAGVFVAGGWTPGYQEAFAAAPGWAEALARAGVPYAGYSAGAALAARDALVGGYVAVRGDQRVAVCDEEAGEDLEEIAIRPGLGLLAAVVDVHCAQWGTLPRLLNAVAIHGLPGGWGIDEHTTLELGDGQARVHGHGSVYRVGPGLDVRILVAGDVVACDAR